MSGATPGPWFRAGLIVKRDCGDRFGPQIARVAGPETAIDPECEANADLIAAAPDLLEFARWVESRGGDNNQMEIFKRARWVIAKATGSPAPPSEGRG